MKQEILIRKLYNFFPIPDDTYFLITDKWYNNYFRFYCKLFKSFVYPLFYLICYLNIIYEYKKNKGSMNLW